MAQTTLYSSDDCYGLDSQVDTNTEDSGVIVVGENNADVVVYRTLVKFDLSSIPATATINSATLRVTYSEAGSFRSDNDRSCKVYRVHRAWVASQATWSDYATSTSWGTDMCANTTTDREASDIGSSTLLTTASQNDSHDFTLTASKIEEMLTGGVFTNNGFLMQNDTETDDEFLFYDNTTATDAYKPQLIVNYTAAGGNPMFFSSGGVTVG